MSIYFEYKLQKLLKSNWKNKKCKYKYNIYREKDCNNIIIWKIDGSKKLLIMINKNFNKILIMILNIYIIYIKYLNYTNNANK